MPLHGFARSRTFSVMPDTEVCSVTLTDRADAKTLVHYPYSYEIMVTYTLTGYSLRVDYKVINHGDEPMYYALGGHPGFCCDFGRAPGDWVLRFSQPELLYSRRVYDTGIISNTQWFRVFDQHGDLPLTRELFCHDALIFERLRSRSCTSLYTSVACCRPHRPSTPYA